MLNIRPVFFLVCALSSSCAALSVQRQPVERAKSAAVVSYLEHMQFSAENDAAPLLGQQIQGAMSAEKLVSGDGTREANEIAAQTYDKLRAAVEQKVGWQMLPAEQVRANGAYAALYKGWLAEKSSLEKAAMELGGNEVPGILWVRPTDELTFAQREALIASLGVDALVFTSVTYKVGKTRGFSIGGVGTKTSHPQAVVRVAAFGAGQEQPIWVDEYAAGEATDRGVTNVLGVTDRSLMKELLLEAADSACGRLMERYQEALAKAP
jgi:hypothetical protein